ncbi:hypothetical protein IWW34DRAFT_757965, partial [Fusarium oxysporum f. sp. albedinis]
MWGSGDRSTVRVISTVAYINQVSTSKCALFVSDKCVHSMKIYSRTICGASFINESYCWRG